MDWLRKNSRKTLLGQLLIEENLLSESQLARAIERQKATGQRLGDVIAELDLISKKQVSAILRKQRSLRFMASVVTVLLGPVPAMAATAAAPVTPVMTQSQKVTAPQQSQRVVAKAKAQNYPAPSTSGLEVVEHGPNSSLDEWNKTLAQSGLRFMAAENTKKADLDPWNTPLAGRDIRVTSKQPQEAVQKAQERVAETGLVGSPAQERETALQTINHHHSRVANTIRNLWGHRECNEYITKLLMDGSNTKGHARMGFHHDAVEAMFKLINLHEQQFPELVQPPHLALGTNAGIIKFPMTRATPV